MKQIIYLFFAALCVALCCNFGVAQAASAGPLLISEVMPGSAVSTKQEFIEIYNVSDQPIDFRTDSWSVQIASSSAADWSNPLRTIKLAGYLFPGNYYLIGTSSQSVEYPEGADVYFSSALSASGGHVRIVNQIGDETRESDSIDWGKDSSSALGGNYILTGSGIAAGSSIYRDTDNDYLLKLSAQPTPQTTTDAQPMLEAPETSPGTDNSTQSFELPRLPLQITELLPNPASPYADDEDEYIEIYNPNDVAVSLAGYSLGVGTTKFKYYKFASDKNIEPLSYAAFYSIDTNLSLGNSGGQVSLIDPNSNVMDQTDVYSTAKDGLVWQLYEVAWQWSSKQTPGQVNEYIDVSTSKAKTSTSGTTTADSEKTTATSGSYIADETEQPTVIHSAVLVVVASLALLYGAYEYRKDLANKISQLRANRGAWRRIWPPFARRRSHRTDQRSRWWQNGFCARLSTRHGQRRHGR